MNTAEDKFRGAIPMLVCRDAAAEIVFCKSVFAAAELSRREDPNGVVLHATLLIGMTMIMVHGEVAKLASRAPLPDGSSPVVIYLYVDDVDATVGLATKAGATVLLPAENMFWGDRVARLIDLSGHVWNVSMRVANPEGRSS